MSPGGNREICTIYCKHMFPGLDLPHGANPVQMLHSVSKRQFGHLSDLCDPPDLSDLCDPPDLSDL